MKTSSLLFLLIGLVFPAMSVVRSQTEYATYAACAEHAAALSSQDKLDSAILYFDRAISIWKDGDGKEQLANGYIGRGRAYMSKAHRGKDDALWQRALEDFTKSIEITPDKYFPYVAIAFYFLQKDQPDIALTYYNKAVEVEPNNARPYFERGFRYYYEKKLYDEALADFSKCVSFITPKSYDEATKTYKITTVDRTITASERGYYFQYRGRCYANKGGTANDNLALADYNSAINEDPGEATAYYNRALVLTNFNKNDAALDDFNKAISLRSNLAGAYRWRGALLYKQQNYDAALRDLLKAVELAPDDYFDAYVRASTISLIRQKPDDAIYYANKALNYELYRGDKAEVYYNRGYAYWLKGKTNQTISDFKKAADYGNAEARKQLRNSFKINY